VQTPARETQLARAALIATIALSVWLSLSYFAGAGYDDSWISLWSGENLARHGMLLNHNGEPVEIASSLLHVLLVALFERIAPGWAFLLNKAAGLLAGAATLYVIYARRDLLFGALPGIWRTPALFVALATLASHPSWLNWNLGGLETPYQTLLLTLYFAALLQYTHSDSARTSSVPLIVIQCLYVLVRSEGFMLIALTAAALALTHLLQRGNAKHLLGKSLLSIGGPVVLAVALLALRMATFGLLAPAPAYAKAGSLPDLLAGLPFGVQYVRDYHLSSALMIVQLVLLAVATFIVFAPVIAGKKSTPGAGVLALGLLLVAWNHAYVMLVRGDWMTYFRFIVPVIPVICIVAALALSHALAHIPTGVTRALPALGMAAMFALSSTNLWQNPRSYVATMPVSSTQRSIVDLFQPSSLPFQERILRLNASYVRDADQALPFLRDALPELYGKLNTKRLVIASYQIGYVPYITKQLHPTLDIEFVDTMGLANATIARMPLPKFVWGIVDGDKLDRIVAGEMQPLSAYVLDRDVNVLYFIAITPEQKQRLTANGWELLWERPQAIFYGKRR
jgi:hypothetical protein